MKKNIILSAFLLFIGVYGCNDIFPARGILSFSVVFPDKGFTIKQIPKAATKINIEITGQSIFEPLKFTLSPKNPSLVVYIPQGDKLIKASAIDNFNNIIISVQKKINVLVYRNNKLVLTFDKVNDVPVNIHTSTTPLPSSTTTPSDLPVQPEKPGTPKPVVTPSDQPFPPSTPVPKPTEPGKGNGGGNGNGGGTQTPTPKPIVLDVNILPDDVRFSPGP